MSSRHDRSSPPRAGHAGHAGRRRRRRRWPLIAAALVVAAVGLGGALLVGSGALPFRSTPTYTSILIASDTDPGDGFGSSVAVDADRIAVGAFRDSDTAARAGAAYVLGRQNERWTQLAKLQAPDAMAADQAGFAIAMEGRWVAVAAVGSFGKLQAGSRSEGAVHLFEEQGAGWKFARTLRLASGQDNDRFGFSLAMEGGRLAVGARGVDADTGAVLLYDLERLDDAPTRLQAPDGLPGDQFGESVDLAEGRLVAGAPGKDGAGDDVGAVYVFHTDEEGAWSNERVTVIESASKAPGARFGVAVATDDNRLLVGASHWAKTDAGGSVWLLSANEPEGTWSAPTRLGEGAIDAAAMPGFRVALKGERAVASAHLDDQSGTDAGAVLSYRLTDSGASDVERLAADDADEHDVYGIALALGDSWLAIGAEAADAAGARSGGLYVMPLP